MLFIMGLQCAGALSTQKNGPDSRGRKYEAMNRVGRVALHPSSSHGLGVPSFIYKGERGP